MRREETFTLSHLPYAVDMASLRVGKIYDSGYASCRITAMWFRRRRATAVPGAGTGDQVTVACIGDLWDNQKPAPADGAAFLAAHNDGRYGGDCKGRWDGARYWGAQETDVIEEHLALLRPMLEAYPSVPAGFDGWWTFR